MPEELKSENLSEITVHISEEYGKNSSEALGHAEERKLESAHFDNVIYELDSLQKKTQAKYVGMYATASDLDNSLEDLQYAKNSAANKERGKLLEKLFDIKDRPYEYRVDVSTETGISTFYLGLKTIDEVEKTDCRIFDFNVHPYKDYIRYSSKDNREGTPVELRRSFDIISRKFIDYKDLWRKNDTTSTLIGNGMIDPVLVHLLEIQRENTDLTNIIMTIRDDQDEIVEMSRTSNIIVQGCAGSGKTVILMHRLSSLQSNDQYFNPSDVLLLVPSGQYSSYISNITTRLAINRIRQLTVEKYYNDLLCIVDKTLSIDDKTLLKTDYSAGVDVVQYVYSDGFINDFFNNYNEYISSRTALIPSLVKMGTMTGMHISEKALSDSWDSYQFSEQIANITKNAKSRKLSKNILDVLNKIERSTSSENTYKAIFKNTIKKRFPNLPANALYGIRRFDLYARLLFCQKYYDNFKRFNLRKYNLICVDEAQDVSPNEYKLIKSLNDENVAFNLFGDVKQCLTPERGITHWSDLYTIIRAPHERSLKKNYRNRDNIIDYCNTKVYKDEYYSPNMESIGLTGGTVEYIDIDNLEDSILSSPCPKERRWVILIPRIMEKDNIKALINSEQVSTTDIDPGVISVMYVDEVKGFEFEKAFIFKDGMSENELYIAATRALEKLAIVSLD